MAAARRVKSASPSGSRKVGTPQGRVLVNGQSGRPAGKCHRKQTADGGPRAAQVRVKRCGKSAPAAGVTRSARQTPPGARSNRGWTARPALIRAHPPGRPRRWMVTEPSFEGEQNPAYRPAHRQPVIELGHYEDESDSLRTPCAIAGRSTLSKATRVRSYGPARGDRRNRASSSPRYGRDDPESRRRIPLVAGRLEAAETRRTRSMNAAKGGPKPSRSTPGSPTGWSLRMTAANTVNSDDDPRCSATTDGKHRHPPDCGRNGQEPCVRRGRRWSSFGRANEQNPGYEPADGLGIAETTASLSSDAMQKVVDGQDTESRSFGPLILTGFDHVPLL